MNNIKLESLTAEEQAHMDAQAVKQAEVNFTNARKNYIAAKAALEALRADCKGGESVKSGE